MSAVVVRPPKSSVPIDVVEPSSGPAPLTRVHVVGQQRLRRPTSVDVSSYPGLPSAGVDAARQPHSSFMGADVVRPMPIRADVVHQSSVVSVSEGPMLGLATGVPLPTSHDPIVIPRGPVAAATPHPLVNLDVGQTVYTAGTQPVGSMMGSKPLGDPVPHLPTGLATRLMPTVLGAAACAQ